MPLISDMGTHHSHGSSPGPQHGLSNSVGSSTQNNSLNCATALTQQRWTTGSWKAVMVSTFHNTNVLSLRTLRSGQAGVADRPETLTYVPWFPPAAKTHKWPHFGLYQESRDLVRAQCVQSSLTLGRCQCGFYDHDLDVGSLNSLWMYHGGSPEKT